MQHHPSRQNEDSHWSCKHLRPPYPALVLSIYAACSPNFFAGTKRHKCGFFNGPTEYNVSQTLPSRSRRQQFQHPKASKFLTSDRRSMESEPKCHATDQIRTGPKDCRLRPFERALRSSKRKLED